jgi:beta-glucosidase/6-phospho-beta-glucosidase/beta-galactosidase
VAIGVGAVAAACGDDDGAQSDAGIGQPDASSIPQPRGPFPDGFRWGSAVAPYQVEGGLHATDWYQWEGEGYCESCPEGENADDGPDFWNHYEVDLANAASISNNSIRLGIDWSRVFPTAESFPDSPDLDAVAHYHDIFAAAREQGLSVMVTLHHFTTPVWLHDLSDLDARPGWAGEGIVGQFAIFAGWAASEYGGDVDLWITINEPIPYMLAGWIAGEGPPGKVGQIETALQVVYNMIEAHARAYDAIHAADLSDADGDGVAAMVSIAHHMRVYLPMDAKDPAHLEAVEMTRYVANQLVLDGLVFGNIDRNFDFDFDDPDDTSDDDSLKGRLDFIGINYYGVSLLVRTPNDNNFPMIGIPFQSNLDRYDFEAPITDFWWAIYPSGLRQVLDEVEAYDLPIMITENGLADATDAQRPRFLLDHLYEVNKAIDEGVDIRGYYHWSLIDNFEWSSGFCPRFGLFRVARDQDGKPRTRGEGADVYREIIDANTVSPDMFADYPGYDGPDNFCAQLPL